MRIEDQVHPASANNLLGSPTSAPTDDPISSDLPGKDSDPLLTGGGLASDQMSSGDPLTDSGGQSAADRQRPIQNWYWLRGSISGGSMGIKVNGIFVGQYSVHVDTEISNYLNNGGNEVTFVPEQTAPDQPVSCHLDVVYSQQSPGSLPVLTYDTSDPSLPISQQSSQQTDSSTDPLSPSSSSTSQPTPSATPAVPTVPTIAPVSTKTPSDAPVTLTFTAT
jgi:hypothetical protein